MKKPFPRPLLSIPLAPQANTLVYLLKGHPSSWITAPLIYSLIVPLLFADLAFSLYQTLCFPAFGILRVRRRDYLVLDRQKLSYLNLLQKVNCVYCGYGNGLLAYLAEIAARTEAHWCPIKHQQTPIQSHRLYGDFALYGDGEAFHQLLDKQKEEAPKGGPKAEK